VAGNAKRALGSDVLFSQEKGLPMMEPCSQSRVSEVGRPCTSHTSPRLPPRADSEEHQSTRGHAKIDSRMKESFTTEGWLVTKKAIP
jgi:hypothetical protein